MNTRRWLVIANVLAASMTAASLPAAADPPWVMAQPCGGLLNALLGCSRPYPYYYGGPFSGATHARYYANHWPSHWRRYPRHHDIWR
jgi:hypothetical protein